MSYKTLIDRFLTWAQTCPDIRAAIIMGSQARQDHAADQWSDLDIMVYAANSQRYHLQTDWLENIGAVWISIVEATGKGDPLIRVLFEDGYNIDFFIYSDEYLKKLAADNLYPRTFHRGAQVILDKDGSAQKIIPPYFDPIPLRPPTREEFREVVDYYWYFTLYIARKILRGELWLAHSWDAKVKDHLLKMLQWHARALNGWDYDTWYFGHFLEEWADPRAVKDLEKVFAHYDKDDGKKALLASMDLFRWVARETARQFAYPYPQAIDEKVSHWITTHLYDGQELKNKD
ncbi:MAG: aminoglycoside 6-adenylyltransferase [Acidobacteriota bacterium]|nr:aminoglycoside 6-adenylyltransferase [Acidobacteriota bacterium]